MIAYGGHMELQIGFVGICAALIRRKTFQDRFFQIDVHKNDDCDKKNDCQVNRFDRMRIGKTKIMQKRNHNRTSDKYDK